MATYIVSYDLTGEDPTHAEMDAHIEDGPWDAVRILGSVWGLSTEMPQDEVFEYIDEILKVEDRLIVVTASSAGHRNLHNSREFSQLWL